MDEHLLKTKTFLLEKKYYIFFICVLVVIFVTYLSLRNPPKNFPSGEVVTILPGQSLQSITNYLYENHVVKSQFVFRTIVILLGGEKRVIAGDYLLDSPVGPFALAYRLVGGRFHLDTLKITIPEGWNVFQIADYLKDNLVAFDKEKFLSLSTGKEGYLFPDTYFISKAARPEAIIEVMSGTFDQKLTTIPGIGTTTEKIEDIVTMASILELEARTTESRRIISGILWKRLSLGMPLQVDATFIYINGKNTYELTSNDLKIDSPYNTYKYKGLPRGPVGNPGIDAIFSAVNPITTKYFYYLSSKSGNMYYAKTFEEHKKNKELYLNK